MGPDELLLHIAHSLRHEVGPEVGQPFAKTQAFMASVVLEKVARQLALADVHRSAETADRVALARDLGVILGGASVPGVHAALATGDLGGLVAALYAERVVLGEKMFTDLLGRVRVTLRARLDRQMEYAA